VLVRLERPSTDPSDEAEPQLFVPCWMLDKAACARVDVRDKAFVQVQALVQLRRLIDELAVTSGEPHPDSRSANAKGDRRA
jgi:hypothetical protein